MDEHTYRLSYLRTVGEFYRCPTSGRVLMGGTNDDKVLCSCGQQSPGAVRMRRQKGIARDLEPPGTHLKAFLPDAAAEDYLDQMERQERDYRKST